VVVRMSRVLNDVSELQDPDKLREAVRTYYADAGLPATATVDDRKLAQSSVTSFHNQATIIHEAMQKVVCKSIGFSLPGAGGDVVV